MSPQPKQSGLERLVRSVLPSNSQPQKSYTGILESYGVEWPIEKAARDTLQNFFDGNNQNLDNVSISSTQQGCEYTIRIENHAEYDHRMLTHLGATSKSDNEISAGGFGEGTKILGLVLLRDYDFSQVKFGSNGWELDFVLDDLPKDAYVDDTKGLFTQLKKVKNKAGNFVEFKTTNEEAAKVFSESRDLFYHSRNTDFQNPTLDIPGVGGFKYLPKGENEYASKKGNFYHTGQRRHYEKEEWNTVEHANLWTYQNLLKKDRDRGIVSRSEVSNTVIPSIIKEASIDDLTNAIYEMKPLWSSGHNFEIGSKIVEEITKKFKEQKIVLKFEDTLLASTGFLSPLIRTNLESAGYTICSRYFADIGMKSAMERFNEMQTHYKLDPSNEEQRKIEILQESASPLGKTNKEVWIYSQESEKSIIQGQYDEQFVWLSQEILQAPYAKALATYVHELDHKHGSDQSAEFSYALTTTLEQVVDAITDQPEVYQRLKSEWSN